MSQATLPPEPVDFTDVQGLVRFGYKRMTRAVYALVQVKNAAAARAWLRTAPVTNAVALNPPPTRALHVAFTAPGLRALGVSESVIAGFSHAVTANAATVAMANRCWIFMVN